VAKYAFFTMDIETFFDTCCIKRLGVQPYEEGAGAEGIEKYLNLLDKYGIKATMYVTTASLAYTLPYLKRAKEKGHSLAFHATEHIEATHLTKEEFERQIRLGIETMREAFGETPKGYRAPCFKLDEERLPIVEKYFSYDSSNLAYEKACDEATFRLDEFSKKADNIYQKGDFFEFRPCIGKLLGKKFPVSGGGYLRLSPWFIAAHAVKKYIKTHDSYLFYVHPFELSDRKEDCIKRLSRQDRLYIKRGRRSYLKKIEKIIVYLQKEGYIFLNMEEYIKGVDDHGQ
jgi:hypothetical protein